MPQLDKSPYSDIHYVERSNLPSTSIPVDVKKVCFYAFHSDATLFCELDLEFTTIFLVLSVLSSFWRHLDKLSMECSHPPSS